MKDITELYSVIDRGVEGRRANGFRDNCTLDLLFPDEEAMHKALEGFSNEQILQAVVEKKLRSCYCAWCKDSIRPNGRWMTLPAEYAQMIHEKTYNPHNQGVCDVCEERMKREDDEIRAYVSRQ